MPHKQWVVVIDAGHGGKDPGCIGITKTKEKDVVLSIALKTGEYIKKYLPDVKVLYTRDDDTFVGLKERAEFANDNDASLFISIHANATTDSKPKGAETWIMGQAKDEANLRLAMKENAVMTYEDNYQAKYEGYDPNSAESFIIFSTMQNTY
ncbi:MAG TPA: N-acetylmuramoyl-L-alanine amidase, partial [Bacteroidales bacterium]|nr:N-acetylmuramoyl-L-alanine amidase [Bacteroidales bacterium]